jgi:hypothetical protein
MRIPGDMLTNPNSMVAYLFVLLCASAIGCGDGRPMRVPISGQVLIDGKPLAYGFVEFIPDNARASMGKLDKQGKFSLTCFELNDGAVVGTNRIAVTAREPIGGNKVRWYAPKKYADKKTSGLVEEISEANDSLELRLSWDGGKPFVEVAEGEGGPRPAGEVERAGQARPGSGRK